MFCPKDDIIIGDMNFFLFALFAYFLGSINGAQFLHHVFRMRNPQHITSIGTRNAGAQNIWMSIGKVPGTIVFVIDSLKGYMVIILSRAFGFEGAALILLGAFAIAGHNWPIFFHFRGGRGFAALIGIFFGFNIWVALAASLISLPFGILRYAGATPFIFLIVGSTALYPMFGIQIVGAYVATAIVLYTKRIHAEWDALRTSRNKAKILKNLLIYDRATSSPPTWRELF